MCFAHAGSNGGGDDGWAVAVTDVVLNDEDRAQASLLGADDRAEIGVINISASDGVHSTHPFFLEWYSYCDQPAAGLIAGGDFAGRNFLPSPDRICRTLSERHGTGRFAGNFCVGRLVSIGRTDGTLACIQKQKP